MQDTTKFDLEPILLKLDSLNNQVINQSEVLQEKQESIQAELDKLNYIVSSLNSNEVLISALVGIVTGLIASFIFARTTKKIELNRLKKQFQPISGTFIRWWKDDKAKSDGRIAAEATIDYLVKNRLTIEVRTLINHGHNAGTDYPQDQIERWTGEIVMDTVRSGTIVWEQRNPDNGNSGFKRIIVENDLNGITLVGEGDKGFGIERFTERKENAS